MAAWRRLVRRLYNVLRPAAAERDLGREIEAHLGLLEDGFRERGMSDAEARRAARLALGGADQTKERHRDARAFLWLDDTLRDLRYGARALAKTPGHTAVAILSLALSIGATTAVYGTVDWLLNRPPGGVLDPDRLVQLGATDRNHPDLGTINFSLLQYADLRAVQDAFTDVAAFGKLPGVVSDDVRADQVVFEYVTGNYFQLLGVRPALGRTLTPEDDVDGAPVGAVLSDAFWKSRFGGDPRIVDAPIRLNGKLARVVGIAPPEFDGYALDWNAPTNVWITVHAGTTLVRPTFITGNVAFYPLIGRLRPGITIELLRQRTQAWMPSVRPALGVGLFRHTDIVATPANEARLGRREQAQRFLGVLLIVCGLILLAACFNVANFLLGRAIARRREIALRAALGASRSRLVRQLLTEAVLLGTASAAAGVFAAIEIAQALSPLPRIYLHLPPTGRALTTARAVDTRMAAAGAVVGVLSVLLFGVPPVLLASFRNPVEDLKNPKPHWTWCGIRTTPRQFVLALQVCLSVMLATTAGLYARSFARAAGIDASYVHPESVLIARIQAQSISADRRPAFYRELLARLNRMPDVVAASIGWNPPFGIGRTWVSLPGNENVPIEVGGTAAAPRFFEAEGVRVLAGREFSDTKDDEGTGLVINQVLARKLWPNENAVGQPLAYGTERRQVTGVVADDLCRDLLGDPQPCVWQPFPMDSNSGYLRVRTKTSPAAFVPGLRAAARELDPDVSIAEDTPLDALLQDMTGAQRMSAWISSSLAIFGLALLALGSLSLFLSMVRDSVREIAIRMALGASNGALAGRIVAQGVAVTAIGIAAGLLGTRVLSSYLADQLYRTATTDRLTLLAVPLVVLALAAVSVYSSAVVATRTSPAEHLQRE